MRRCPGCCQQNATARKSILQVLVFSALALSYLSKFDSFVTRPCSNFLMKRPFSSRTVPSAGGNIKKPQGGWLTPDLPYTGQSKIPLKFLEVRQEIRVQLYRLQPDTLATLIG